jgi:hypothetical protein
MLPWTFQPTIWTQWSRAVAQFLVMMPEVYVCHVMASTQMERGDCKQAPSVLIKVHKKT